MLNKLKKNDKKGFTLVELIVVLVILAILVALLVPALTGYIDRAKNKSIVAETRSAVMAAQTLVDEQYAKENVATIAIGAATSYDDTTNTATIGTTDIKTLAEVNGDIDTDAAKTKVENGKVTIFTYKKDGRTCTYTKGATNGTDGAYNVTTP